MPRLRQSVPISIVAVLASVFAFACRAADPAPPVLTLDAAIRFALETNPQLAAVRTQRGIAAAGVVLAKIYPHNPQVESTVLRASGPESAGITNRTFNEIIVSEQLEIRGQRRKRIAAACAALTRTEWEIAGQELSTAIGVIRAYNTLLYRQQKLGIIEQTIRLNEQIVDRGKSPARVRPVAAGGSDPCQYGIGGGSCPARPGSHGRRGRSRRSATGARNAQ